MSDSNSGKSFVDRFAKKSSSFTSQNLQQKQAPTPSQNFSDKTKPSQKNNINKNIDPQKKMQAELIYLVKGVDAGRNAWYYVLVDRLKVQLFLKALNDDIIHLENYGEILFSAYGDEPPESITNKLKQEYGIEG
jgi:hypothetical protein